MALLELWQGILEQCTVLTSAEFEKDVTSLFVFLCHLVNASQAEISMQALQIIDSDYVLMNYIVHNDQRIRLVEQCLHDNRKWKMLCVMCRGPLESGYPRCGGEPLRSPSGLCIISDFCNLCLVSGVNMFVNRISASSRVRFLAGTSDRYPSARPPHTCLMLSGPA